MPEIYNHSHPYFSPGDGRYQSPSFMHKIIFGNGLEHSFPEKLHILTKHESDWFHYCADYSNSRSELLLVKGSTAIVFGLSIWSNKISKATVVYGFSEIDLHKK